MTLSGARTASFGPSPVGDDGPTGVPSAQRDFAVLRSAGVPVPAWRPAAELLLWRLDVGAVLERAATEERPFMSSAVLVGERGKKAALFMLQRLLELTPASVGGSLPTNDFWDMGREE